ncbi:purine-binding chemotaxis protein CheW [Thiohalospira halophila DSM 15071]|uniref:Purine-binding chemotaxis protein CheW n=1 Tax=Thiohalospira halophila DSM 15071 TaxID=1123397 RepID=A0A1I1QC09_9GAMM|nr:chemotaxis protein CheW [Thiohalospira halophila]SFD16763.1 purine-binding chemotaxis protein CheW [Thiohalospira halophila DSM 15071]
MNELAASVPGTEATGNQEAKYLAVKLGDDAYGITIMRVKEIIEYSHVTPVPLMPESIRGAINLRGHMVPIVDLARRLGVGETAITRWTCVVIVEVRVGEQCLDVGLTADAVSRVWDVSPLDIEAAPNFGGQIRTDFIEGMAKVGEDGFVILLDIDRMLSMEDVEQLGRMAGQVDSASIPPASEEESG